MTDAYIGSLKVVESNDLLNEFTWVLVGCDFFGNRPKTLTRTNGHIREVDMSLGIDCTGALVSEVTAGGPDH